MESHEFNLFPEYDMRMFLYIYIRCVGENDINYLYTRTMLGKLGSSVITYGILNNKSETK